MTARKIDLPVRCVVDARNTVGESPVWSASEQALYWVDILAPAVYRWHPASGERREWPMPAAVGSIGLREAGGLVVALRSGFHLFDLETGESTLLVHPEPEPADEPPQRRQGRARRRLLGRHDGRPAREGARRRALPARRRPCRRPHVGRREGLQRPGLEPGRPDALPLRFARRRDLAPCARHGDRRRSARAGRS